MPLPIPHPSAENQAALYSLECLHSYRIPFSTPPNTSAAIAPASPPLRLIWLHGWGHSHAALLPLAQSFTQTAENILLDLPGFGQSPAPSEPWDTATYAALVSRFLATLSPDVPTLLVGHSLGCRVAIRLAGTHALSSSRTPIQGLILLAAAGLRKRRSLFFKFKASLLKLVGRLCGICDSLFGTSFKATYSARFGSSDYKQTSGTMRGTFIQVIQENLADIAPHITCPVLLLYGENDVDTPPLFGHLYASMMPAAQCIVLPRLDHISILTTGRHQTIHQMAQFLAQRHTNTN